MTNPFESNEYVSASALVRVFDKIRELEAKDSAIFEVKTTAGRPASRGEYHFVINTFDGTVEIYADGGWHDLIAAGGGGYTDEEAQDAVGNILVDTVTIDFTYDDATPEITADVIPGGVDHDSLLNYDANDHIDHTTVTLTAGDGLSGGGTIAANRTFDVDMLGLEDMVDPGYDRIYFWDDGAGKSEWLIANAGLGISGTDLNVDILGIEDLAAPAGDRISFYDDTVGKFGWLVVGDGLP